MEPLRFKNDKYVMPPGSLTDRLPHPFESSIRSVEVAIFFEHRYAFFFWAKWHRLLKEEEIIKDIPPTLVTLDWHQDLAFPTDQQKQWLDELDMESNTALSLFSWSSLSALNDEQIATAAYLNLIGDIYVHCRQGIRQEWEDMELIDKYGNVHQIKRFKTFESMEASLLSSTIDTVYFDIDLDFFVLGNPYSTGGATNPSKFSYLAESAITEILNFNRPLIQWILKRLCGFTIAIEPEHTGGLMRAMKYLKIIDSLYFKPSLLTYCGSNWKNNSNWKHLKY
ncbi:hypothetical protein [Arachidicoccus sp.]|uniref:hypothetical protein n=1 Tax=Arachidicoccus sp. TaxID=1872624 RepID=UPI003D1C50B9